MSLWDGAQLASTNGNGPTFRVRSPAAVAHMLRAPGQLGVGRAYVSGELEVDDLDAALEMLDSWQPPPLDRGARARLLLAAARAAGLQLPPRPPAAELRPRGRRHSRARDARAVRHHYDLPAEFFELFLGPHDLQLRALLARRDDARGGAGAKAGAGLHEARPQAGERVLDIGCGWGSFAIHAAANHGAQVVGITLSAPQAELARRRVAERGLEDLVDIRVADYRELAGDSFDAIASIGMVEHVGASRIDLYARQVARLLRPGGRLLNHGITRLRHGDPEAGPFSERYVFPDAAPLHLSRIQLALERAGIITDHVEGLPATTRPRSPTGCAASKTASTTRCASPAPSACASGASI